MQCAIDMLWAEVARNQAQRWRGSSNLNSRKPSAKTSSLMDDQETQRGPREKCQCGCDYPDHFADQETQRRVAGIAREEV